MASESLETVAVRTSQGASRMQALLILLICLVTLALIASRYGVDSRDGLDWSPPDRARSRGRG